MKPQEFLDITKGLPKGRAYKDIEGLKEKMERGVEIDPLYLDLDVSTCTIVDHEGRHRALAAQELKTSRVPVIVYHKDGKYHADLRDLGNCSCNVFNAKKQS
jgi:ParB-like nuclease domain.